MSASITAVKRDDMDPMPRVELTVVGTGVGRIDRIVGSDRAPVRGAINIEMSIGAVFVDYEAPFGVPVVYEVVTATERARATAVTLVYPFQNWDTLLVHDPLAPSIAMPWVLTDAALQSLEYERDADLNYPLGAVRPLATGGRMRAAASVPLVWYTQGANDEAMLADLLSPIAICVRSVDPIPLPRVTYLHCDAVRRVRDDWFSLPGDRLDTWSAQFTEVRAPAASVTVPTHTWGEVIDTYASWAQLIANKATWADVIRDPAPGV